MRLAGVLVSVTLLGSIASADDAKPADPKPSAAVAARTKVPLRVVRILPETHQALLFDKNRGTHVLADVGGTVAGYTVEDIDDEEVTLEGAGGAEVVLAAPDQSWRHRRDEATASHPAAKPAEPAKVADPVPADPYGESVPVDPYAEPAVREAEAPADEAPVRVAEAPVPAPAATPAPGVVAPTPPAPAPAAVAPPAPAAPVTDGPVLLARADVNAALADFGRLTMSIHGAFTPAGVRVDAVNAGSLFARAGLLPGDVITTVNNQPLRSLDDAASLYARAATARNVTVQLQRGGKPATLRVAIQ